MELKLHINYGFYVYLLTQNKYYFDAISNISLKTLQATAVEAPLTSYCGESSFISKPTIFKSFKLNIAFSQVFHYTHWVPISCRIFHSVLWSTWTVDHGVAKSQTPLSNFHFQGRCPSRCPQELMPSRRRCSLHTRAGSSGQALNCRFPWPGRAVHHWYLIGQRRQDAGPPVSRVRLPVARSQGQVGSPLFSFFF